mmetsp:Transcript_51091/g.122317  ORF Transcript_51091/g.122317 Transcript_51091/m.122317 type:complete len:243 (+) Transcript_51091:291-1019(+)
MQRPQNLLETSLNTFRKPQCTKLTWKLVCPSMNVLRARYAQLTSKTTPARWEESQIPGAEIAVLCDITESQHVDEVDIAKCCCCFDHREPPHLTVRGIIAKRYLVLVQRQLNLLLELEGRETSKQYGGNLQDVGQCQQRDDEGSHGVGQHEHLSTCPHQETGANQFWDDHQYDARHFHHQTHVGNEHLSIVSLLEKAILRRVWICDQAQNGAAVQQLRDLGHHPRAPERQHHEMCKSKGVLL